MAFDNTVFAWIVDACRCKTFSTIDRIIELRMCPRTNTCTYEGVLIHRCRYARRQGILYFVVYATVYTNDATIVKQSNNNNNNNLMKI
jgi:hypothetical protein